MIRKFMKALEPFRNSLSRTVRGCSAGAGSGKEGSPSAFERNSVSKEQQLTERLKKSLPGITYVSIQDISGGCGAMFEVNIEAKEFNGLSRVKQHRLVTESLKSEISEMHGIRINTTPQSSDSFHTKTTPPPSDSVKTTPPTSDGIKTSPPSSDK